MIDVAGVLGATVPPRTTAWATDDVILYQLAVGAGDPPTDPGELVLTYEDGLRTLPTFAVIPAMPVAGEVLDLPGFAIDRTLMLHGEQEIEVHRPLPASTSTARTSGRVAAVHDKGKAAVAVLETTTEDDDGVLFVNRYSMFLRGEGGFGGDPGPSSSWAVPAREPDAVARAATLPQQALLYRLTGDRNPLHADPVFAAAAGFDRPILHGLCTFGFVTRLAVRHVFAGDPGAVGHVRARFTGVVYPGQAIDVALWPDDTGVDLVASVEATPVIQARLRAR